MFFNGAAELLLGASYSKLPYTLTVIALTITNSGDSPQSLIVGTDYNNADQRAVGVPRMVVVTGYPGNVVIEIPAHGSYRTLLDARDFEEVINGGSTNLSGFISAPGQQLQIVLHCGAHTVPGVAVDPKPWKGDLVSGWLKI
jgi:hypothetical protein